MSDNENGEFETPPTSSKAMKGTPDISTEIYRIGVKVPIFWPEKPAVWFAQMESQFSVANITADATKYNHIVAQLDSQYAAEVEDIIVSPPATDKYKKIKEELIKRLSVSRQKKVKQLLSQEELGDRKPSQFLRHLRHLAGPNIPDEFLISIWTSRLPNNLQFVIASKPNDPIEELAELADRVHDIATPQVAAASAPDSQMAILMRQVSELTNDMKTLKSQFNSDRPSRSRSRASSRKPRNRSSSQRSQSSYRKFPECWYHAKFGEKATRCVKPCDYQAGNERGTR
ncbi:uncharacterized protein LOC125234225 [Leguminivora glycinivorella]|uniref:uncharacterized protein LOC125234225 n=1 Tax=Leguminivora glycinivorella TaxID=1035111 RepID=UPI00200BBB45|nr:uncharacterized protein LOC125234225 [Leguminivora glycinivorella]